MITAVDSSVILDVIVAHAQHHADRLLARDDGFKRDYFDELVLFSPTS